MSQALHLGSPALVKASGCLNISLDPSETLALIARTAAEITGAASCRIELLLPSGRFETGAVWGLPTRVPPDLTGHLAHLSRRVVQSGQVLLIPDVGHELEGRLPAGLIEAGCGSVIGLPLRALDRVQGILWIHFHGRRDFTDRDVALLSSFANQATIALENARLHSDLQASKVELEGAKRSLEELYRIGLAIQEPLDFILQGARELLALDRIAIFLPNAAGDALECVTAAGLPASAGAPRILLSSAGGILSRAFAEKREFIVPDEGVPCEGLTLPALAGPEVFPSGPFVVFPLMVRGEAIGLLAADSQPSRRPLSHKIVAPLRMFANQAAIAIENTRLYEATVRQFKELKGLYDLGQAISSSLSLDEQLGLLVERLSQAAGAQRVLVGLGDAEDTGRLRLSLAYDASKPDPWLRQLDLSAERYPEIQEVMRTGRPLVIPEVVAEPLLAPVREGLKPLDLRSMIVMPLIVREKTIGAISLGYVGQARTFTDEQIGVLRSFATQAAIAIEKARLHAAALRRGEELGALLRATRTVMSGLDLRGTLDRIIEEAAQISGIPHVKVILVDNEAKVLRIGAAAGRPAEMFAGFQHAMGSGLSGLVATTGQPLFVPDCQHDSRNFGADQDRALGIQTYLGLPIKRGDEVLGVLTFNTTEPHQYSPEELGYLAAFADQVAVALENARLYGASEQRATELDTLREIDQAITTRLELPAVLEAVVAGAMRMLSNPFAQIILWDEATQRLRFGAALGPEAERVRSQTFEMGRGINGTVALSRQPIILDDYQASPYVVPECADVVATITVPILFGDRLLGVLHSHTTQPDRRFTTDDLRRFQMLASQAAIAIENARLYEAIRQHAAELEARVQERTHELEAANQRLQDASRHKSEFLANMSHEIRTPLNSVIGFSELLQDQRVGPLTERQARYLGHIHKAGKHLIQLIGDILDLSKVEAGKFVLQPELLPVAQTLEDILVIARGLANKKTQTIEGRIESGLPPLQADPVRFKQILFNLLSNAVKFTPEKGTITLFARKLESEEARTLSSFQASQPPGVPAGVWLEIRVTDTGIGIKTEDLPRLFREFVQLETTQAQKHEGTGLGLALTKRLVELHGGRVWAESGGEGQGSTFTVLLPLSGPGVPTEALAGARSS
jgi:GAF domain-containing protein